MRCLANAVRYGTAKGEWFLSLVSLLAKVPVSVFDRRSSDCCPAFWRSYQDEAEGKEILSRVRPYPSYSPDLKVDSMVSESDVTKEHWESLRKVETFPITRHFKYSRSIRLAPLLYTRVAMAQFPNVV